MTVMMTCVITFILASVFWLGLLIYGLRRGVRYIQANPERRTTLQRALTQLLGRDDTPAE